MRGNIADVINYAKLWNSQFIGFGVLIIPPNLVILRRLCWSLLQQCKQYRARLWIMGLAQGVARFVQLCFSIKSYSTVLRDRSLTYIFLCASTVLSAAFTDAIHPLSAAPPRTHPVNNTCNHFYLPHPRDESLAKSLSLHSLSLRQLSISSPRFASPAMVQNYRRITCFLCHSRASCCLSRVWMATFWYQYRH